jgi:hypothetical protein
MSHFAKVINGVVVEVNVADQEWVDAQPDKWAWVQTSYNMRGGVYYDSQTNMPHEDQTIIQGDPGRERKNYAGIGYRYDSARNAFIPPTPYPSWILNEETCLWDAPVPYPDDNKQYVWNETEREWTYTGYYIDPETNE